MKILIFEYSISIGIANPSLTIEAEKILEGLIKDLDDAKVDYLITDEFIDNFESECNPIKIEDDLETWLEKNIRKYDACLFLAPEDDYISYNITRIIEENNVRIIGSDSEAVLKCSDKILTHNALKDKVPFIESEKIQFSELKNYKEIFKNNRKVVIKPADGVSSQGVKIANSYADYIKASAKIKRLTQLPYFILQDFIEGINVSVSVLTNGKTAIPLSLNLQDIQIDNNNISYNGGIVPFKHNLSDKAKNIAKTAVESVDGLKGYVGVDLILNEKTEEIIVIELNPRLTTPYVALREILNFNLTKAIINSINGELPGNITCNGTLTFHKKDDHLIIE